MVAEITWSRQEISVVAETPDGRWGRAQWWLRYPKCQQSSVVAEILQFVQQSSVVAEILWCGGQSSVVAEIPERVLVAELSGG